MEYSIYNSATGEITRSGENPEVYRLVFDEEGKLRDPTTGEIEGWTIDFIRTKAREGEEVYAGQALNDTKFYILNGAPEPRPTIDCLPSYEILANETGEVIFTLPAGTTIYHQGGKFEDCSDFAFTTDTPGEYVFSFEPLFPHQPALVSIYAL